MCVRSTIGDIEDIAVLVFPKVPDTLKEREVTLECIVKDRFSEEHSGKDKGTWPLP
jgi:hypothetical protein